MTGKTLKSIVHKLADKNQKKKYEVITEELNPFIFD